MEDRIIELPSLPREQIEKEGFGWYLDGENEDYLSADLIQISKSEIADFKNAAEQCFRLYIKAFEHIRKNNLWDFLEIPEAMVPIIEYSYDNGHPLILSRFDFGGGVDGLPLKLIEMNADTCTMLPESFLFQDWAYEKVRLQTKGQFNYLHHDLVSQFQKLMNQFPNKEPNLLLTSLGYIEDQLNLEVIKRAAEEAGFFVGVSDLENVEFAEEGVFLETIDGFIQFPFIYKLVPWEFIMYEEPELLDILSKFILSNELIVVSPAYSIAFQAKRIMTILYNLFPTDELLLPTFNDDSKLQGHDYVIKSNFGRLGENIEIINSEGRSMAKNEIVQDDSARIYQKYTALYQDEDDDYYQPSVFCSNGLPSGLSFRRKDGMIMDDDIDFVSHVIF